MKKKIVSIVPSPEKIPLSVPRIQGNEWVYIKECLDTNWVSSSGRFVDRFEEVVAGYVGRKYAVACINGTAALHCALLTAGITTGEEVIMPALTFVAPANAVRYSGAFPVFVDVQPDIWQLDPDKVMEFLESGCRWTKGKLVNRRTRRVVTAILPVHILGHPVDMDPIRRLAAKYQLRVIEDAAESLGAEYRGHKVGADGDMACISFNGNKIITCGGGGMILTDDRKFAERARYLTTQAKDDPIENIHGAIGYNYRLSNIQAAMGTAQLEQLDRFVQHKRDIAGSYMRSLAGIEGITLQGVASWAKSSFWLNTVLVDRKQYGMDSRQLMRKLAVAEVETRPFWCPLPMLKPYQSSYSCPIPVTRRLYRDGISLPSSVGLTTEQQQRVVQVLSANSRNGYRAR